MRPSALTKMRRKCSLGRVRTRCDAGETSGHRPIASSIFALTTRKPLALSAAANSAAVIHDREGLRDGVAIAEAIAAGPPASSATKRPRRSGAKSVVGQLALSALLATLAAALLTAAAA